jgi:hypothetical protein
MTRHYFTVKFFRRPGAIYQYYFLRYIFNINVAIKYITTAFPKVNDRLPALRDAVVADIFFGFIG